MITFVRFIDMKSRMKGDFHVRFRGNVGVKFPCVTRLCAIWGQCGQHRSGQRIKNRITKNNF